MAMSELCWCVDDRHGRPCPADCPLCREECDPSAVATTVEAEAMFPEWEQDDDILVIPITRGKCDDCCTDFDAEGYHGDFAPCPNCESLVQL